MKSLSSQRLRQALASQPLPQIQHTLLLVDDEPHNLDVLTDLFADDYQVLSANDGQEALELLQQHPQAHKIAAIISDQRMPRLSGVEFLEASLQIIPKAKRLLLTGYTDVDDMIGAINLGQIYKFLIKPFDPQDLRLTVKRALEAYELEEKNRVLVAELKQLNEGLEEQVKERTLELRSALEQLKEANATKDKFFSIIAHDLKNPLNAVMLGAEFVSQLGMNLERELIIRTSEKVYEGSRRIYLLLENLLSWASLQRNGIRCHPIPQKLAHVVVSTFEFLGENAKRKNITLAHDVPSELEIYADPNMLSVILQNLITNAIKFTHSGGWVRVSAHSLPEGVEVTFQDTGVGMDARKLAELFRLDVKHAEVGTASESGTGLGLMLCKEFVERQGGSIQVESQLGQGSLFRVRFPIPAPSK